MNTPWPSKSGSKSQRSLRGEKEREKEKGIVENEEVKKCSTDLSGYIRSGGTSHELHAPFNESGQAKTIYNYSYFPNFFFSFTFIFILYLRLTSYTLKCILLLTVLTFERNFKKKPCI